MISRRFARRLVHGNFGAASGVVRPMLGLTVMLLLASSNASDVLEVTQPTCGPGTGVCREAHTTVRNGARAQVDPLGRGVWLIDDENDEVLLVSAPVQSLGAVCAPQVVTRFPTGRWPEQLVVAPDGRVFVSARESGQLLVIEPDLRSWPVALAPEPKGLALDVTHQRLYVALITALEVVELDARTVAVLRRRSVAFPPDFLALCDAGLLVASRRSDVVSVFDGELRPRSSIDLGPKAPLPSLGLSALGLLGR